MIPGPVSNFHPINPSGLLCCTYINWKLWYDLLKNVFSVNSRNKLPNQLRPVEFSQVHRTKQKEIIPLTNLSSRREFLFCQKWFSSSTRHLFWLYEVQWRWLCQAVSFLKYKISFYCSKLFLKEHWGSSSQSSKYLAEGEKGEYGAWREEVQGLQGYCQEMSQVQWTGKPSPIS